MEGRHLQMCDPGDWGERAAGSRETREPSAPCPAPTRCRDRRPRAPRSRPPGGHTLRPGSAAPKAPVSPSAGPSPVRRPLGQDARPAVLGSQCGHSRSLKRRDSDTHLPPAVSRNLLNVQRQVRG